MKQRWNIISAANAIKRIHVYQYRDRYRRYSIRSRFVISIANSIITETGIDFPTCWSIRVILIVVILHPYLNKFLPNSIPNPDDKTNTVKLLYNIDIVESVALC
jgi:hypothetical protein